jgi:alpha-1,2-mannosyltransferase
MALLVSPISWSHHWVYAVPALAVGVHVAATTRSRLVVATVVVGVLVFLAWPLGTTNSALIPGGIIWLPVSHNNAEFHWDVSQALLGNAEVFSGLLLLIVLTAACVVRNTMPSRDGSARQTIAA